ncbi:MAG TPA: hypothetical protein VFB58_00285 [Chloroflexota bacterium]|nr:hypothetical protein [Chloroflexota bacterium]
MIKRQLLALLLIVGVLTAVTPATGASAASIPRAHAAVVMDHPHFLDKTRFLLHTGAAFYAFHHWVIRVWQQGGFKKGAKHRVSNIIKAGIATLFAAHELQVAYNIAKKSNSKTLHAIIAPVQKLLSIAQRAGSSLRHGNYNASDVQTMSHDVSSLASTAASAGIPIRDIVTPIAGL